MENDIYVSIHFYIFLWRDYEILVINWLLLVNYFDYFVLKNNFKAQTISKAEVIKGDFKFVNRAPTHTPPHTNTPNLAMICCFGL